MSAYKSMKRTFISEYKERAPQYKERLITWNRQAPVVMAGKPTNIARARELGYKAKQGVLVARVAVRKGRRMRPAVGGGRKPSKAGRFFSRAKSLQVIAEEKAARKFTNLEVLNSYFVGETGEKRFYEIIMLDRSNPSVTADKRFAAVVAHKARAQRGLTSAGRKGRGLRA
jgi:large subunit ribosomal protein L15e